MIIEIAAWVIIVWFVIANFELVWNLLKALASLALMVALVGWLWVALR